MIAQYNKIFLIKQKIRTPGLQKGGDYCVLLIKICSLIVPLPLY